MVMSKKLLALIITITALSPLFFYQLGSSSLVSFDEAWYAAIAKNQLAHFQPFKMTFNGQPFGDHPPTGFWLIASSFKILGVSDFSARLPSAILGLGCLVLVFLICRHLKSPAAGIASVFALASSPWFISRARSANLDIFLTFFFLLSFYFLFTRHLKSLSLSLSLLLLTKTLVPWTILPSLYLCLKSQLIFPLLWSLLPFIVWVLFQFSSPLAFLIRYFSIGIPESKISSDLWGNLLRTKSYLHYGLGNIFRPLLLLSPLSLISPACRQARHNSYFISLIIFLITFLTPNIFSSKGQIWHLIPSFPVIIILSLTGFYYFIKKISSSKIASVLTLTLTLTLSIPQINRNWREFIGIPGYISSEAILSRTAGSYAQDLAIDDRFTPVAVYYSGKTVWDQPEPTAENFFSRHNSLLITHSWRLSSISSDRYRILQTDRDMILILIY
jgi:4-amino-4-deoxy-L-arabinose transferase-like glycosyltransferase